MSKKKTQNRRAISVSSNIYAGAKEVAEGLDISTSRLVEYSMRVVFRDFGLDVDDPAFIERAKAVRTAAAVEFHNNAVARDMDAISRIETAFRGVPLVTELSDPKKVPRRRSRP